MKNFIGKFKFILYSSHILVNIFRNITATTVLNMDSQLLLLDREKRNNFRLQEYMLYSNYYSNTKIFYKNIQITIFLNCPFNRENLKDCWSWHENLRIPQQTSIIKVPVALALYQNVRYTIREKSIQQSPHQWDKTGIQFQFKQPYWFPYKELSSRNL